MFSQTVISLPLHLPLSMPIPATMDSITSTILLEHLLGCLKYARAVKAERSGNIHRLMLLFVDICVLIPPVALSRNSF